MNMYINSMKRRVALLIALSEQTQSARSAGIGWGKRALEKLIEMYAK